MDSIVRSEFSYLQGDQLLALPTSALLGVDSMAAELLSRIGVNTVFDLGASWLFANARAASTGERGDLVSARFGMAPSDWLVPGASFATLSDIAQLPAKMLRGLESISADELSAGLDVSTIADLANWPPHRAARQLLSASLGATADVDEVQTERLRPRFAEYPTERAYFDTLVMLQMPASDQLIDPDGPIPLSATEAGPTGFRRPAVGAVLTYSQSWFAQGITLGHLLHCLPLAPGEATRVAVVDWSRRSRAGETEQIEETEQLDNVLDHARAISEVQNAVADEFQQGRSRTAGGGRTTSRSRASTSGTGFFASLFVSGSNATTSQASRASGWATSASWTQGERSILASLHQDINDSTEQHASAVRNRRATAVREVSQSEHSQISTRVVANYNHMHALTVQYFEVVQVYRTETQLHRAERCLYLPIELPVFNASVVDRYRGVLLQVALNERVRELLLDEGQAVGVQPRGGTGFVAASNGMLTGAMRSNDLLRRLGNLSETPPPVAAGDPVRGEDVTRPPFSMAWDPDAVTSIARIVGRPLARPGSTALFLPPDAEVTAITTDGFQPSMLRIERVGTSGISLQPSPGGGYLLSKGVTLGDLDGITLSKGDASPATGMVVLQLSYRGRFFELPLPVSLGQGVLPERVASLVADNSDRTRELLSHLNANRSYYGQAIIASLDPASIVLLLSRFRWNGRPLADQVEPRPLAIIGNFLVFRAPVELAAGSGVVNEQGGEISWGSLLEARGLSFEARDQRLIPVPTSGVFAEAVLGRSNSAELLDITRFWNWQESPIPLQPTDIVPPNTESRAQPENVTPGQLSQPLVNLVAPTNLPDPAGLGAIFSVLGNGGLFRDLSGLAGTQQLAQNLAGQSAQAATAAGQLASMNLRTEAQKAVAFAQVFADIVKSALGGGITGGGRSASNGLSGEGARVNLGRSIDMRMLPGSSSAAPTRSPSGGAIGTPRGGSPGGMPLNGSSGGPLPGGSITGVPSLPTYSREIAYADTAALGFSPDATASVGDNLPAAVYDSAQSEEMPLDESSSSDDPVEPSFEPAALLQVDIFGAPVPATLLASDPMQRTNEPMQHALENALVSRLGAEPRLQFLAIGVAALTPGSTSFRYAGLRDQEEYYGASVLKVPILFASHALLAIANQLLLTPRVPSEKDKFLTTLRDLLAQQVPPVVRTFSSFGRFAARETVPTVQDLEQIFDFPDGASVALKKGHRDDIELALVTGTPYESIQASARCIHRLGYGWVNALLTRTGFFDPQTKNGLWLAGDYVKSTWGRYPIPADGGPTNYGATVETLVRLFAYFWLEAEAGRPALRDGLGTGSWMGEFPATFDILKAKVGLGPPARPTAAEVAIIRRQSDRRPFVVAWLNAPPNQDDAQRLIIAPTINRIVEETIAAAP